MTAADRGIVNHQLIVRATANGQALSQLVMTHAGAIKLMMNVRHRMGLPDNGTAFSIAQTQRPSRDARLLMGPPSEPRWLRGTGFIRRIAAVYCRTRRYQAVRSLTISQRRFGQSERRGPDGRT